MISKNPQMDLLGPVSAITATAMLLALLWLHLIPALFAGMLVFLLVHAAAPLFGRRISGHSGRLSATIVLAVIVVLGLTSGLMALIGFLNRSSGGLDQLWAYLATTLNEGQVFLPPWITDQFPSNASDLKAMVMRWFNLYTPELRVLGKEAGVTFVQVIIGMVIGAMIAVHEVDATIVLQPFAQLMLERIRRFHDAFRDVVAAQSRIALINASLTWVFLGLLLPLAGIELPLIKTLVVITAIVGMLPVIGNVISNTLIVLVSISVSLLAAGLSLIFLMVLHKGEYFLNARIVGHRIDSHAWELLLAILVMDAAFGLPGIAAAPIYYAYLKRELLAGKWL